MSRVWVIALMFLSVAANAQAYPVACDDAYKPTEIPIISAPPL